MDRPNKVHFRPGSQRTSQGFEYYVIESLVLGAPFSEIQPCTDDCVAGVAHKMIYDILECSVDTFLEHYAPFNPSPEHVVTVFNELKKKSLLEEVGNGDNTVWALADNRTPFKGTKATIVEALEDIIRVPGEVDGRQCLFSHKDHSPSNAGACIGRDPIATTVGLSDVVTVAEIKRPGSDSLNIKNNRLKLLSEATKIMNHDPRRMWVYGISTEEDEMAVWYFCRSHLVKSEPFDFLRDVNALIRVFLSLLYATDEEIGYDPTVYQVKFKGDISYVYQLGTKEVPRYYRTVDLIFAAQAPCITGRKTRVWKVVEVKGYGEGQLEAVKDSEHVVLKDLWLDEGSRSEQENQKAIFERLKNVQLGDYQWDSPSLRGLIDETLQNEKYKDYFMEITNSCQLGKTKDRHKLAKTSHDILSFAEPKPIGALHSVSGTMQSGDRSGTPANIPSRTAGKKKKSRLREYKTKQQHRLIYRHVGCPLSDAKDLPTSFYAIHDTFIALVCLYLAGWTHRDVSAGNIIIVETDGGIQGKLSDLEYAKEFSSETSGADPKTGTAYFMPVEIHRSYPIYNPPALERPLKVNKGKDPRTILVLPTEEAQATEEEQARPVKFRFQHDLESLWWVIVWILIYRVGGDAALWLMEAIFTSSDTPSESRVMFFTTPNNDLRNSIDKKLKFLVPIIYDMRHILANSYKDKDKSEDMLNPRTYTDIYDDMWEGIGMLYASAQIAIVKDIGFQHPAPVPESVGGGAHGEQSTHTEKDTKKRPRSNSKPKDDDEYTPSRRNSTRAKAAPTGLRPTRKKRAAQLPRRKMRQ